MSNECRDIQDIQTPYAPWRAGNHIGFLMIQDVWGKYGQIHIYETYFTLEIDINVGSAPDHSHVRISLPLKYRKL